MGLEVASDFTPLPLRCSELRLCGSTSTILIHPRPGLPGVAGFTQRFQIPPLVIARVPVLVVNLYRLRSAPLAPWMLRQVGRSYLPPRPVISPSRRGGPGIGGGMCRAVRPAPHQLRASWMTAEMSLLARHTTPPSYTSAVVPAGCCNTGTPHPPMPRPCR